MIASLGMYDFGPAVAANDRFWTLVRDRLRAAGHVAPEALTRGDVAFWDAWQSPDLILSQTCGYPFRARLQGKVALVGTPDYGLPSCPAGHYYSVLVARRDDPRGRIEEFDAAPMAFNEDMSQSGWAGPVSHLLSLGLTPKPSLRSGAHQVSAQAVASGKADLAGLDAVTWAMLQGQEPAVGALKVIGHTPPTPVLPFITALGTDRAAILAALTQAIADLTQQDRVTLHLRGLVDVPESAYLAIPTPPPPAHFGMPD